MLYLLLEDSSALGSLTQQHPAESYCPSDIHSTNTLSPTSAPNSPSTQSSPPRRELPLLPQVETCQETWDTGLPPQISHTFQNAHSAPPRGSDYLLPPAPEPREVPRTLRFPMGFSV